MKIGIIASSNYSRYALALLIILEKYSVKPTHIIIINGPIFKGFSRYLKTFGIKSAVKKVMARFFSSNRNQNKDYLLEYATSKKISLTNQRLTKVCQKKGIKVLQFSNINSPEAVKTVNSIGIDILINAGRELFRKDIISAVKSGIFNTHMGLLPEFRGMNVLEWSLFYNKPVGVTLHFIDIGIDTGDILLFKEIPYENGDTITVLREKSTIINIELIIDAVNLIRKNVLPRKKQLPQEGLQYFVMHPRLKKITENKIVKLTAK